MSRLSSSRIGEGVPAVVLEETVRRFPGLEVIHRGDDIRRPTDWRIHDEAHSIIVHLGGRMDCLETEMDGHGGSSGGAVPGEIWTVPSGRRYASHACGGSIEYAVLRLQPDVGERIGGSVRGEVDLRPVAGARDEFLHVAVRQLLRSMQGKDDISAMLADSLSQSLCLHLLQAFSVGGEAPKLRNEAGPMLSPALCRRMRDHVQEKIDERITLAELAGLTGMTTHQFLVAFRKVFGCTPGQYLMQQRLRMAQRLLLESRGDISTIALDCGFSSHSHLTTSFSKHLGVSPKVFRENARPHQIPRWRS